MIKSNSIKRTVMALGAAACLTTAVTSFAAITGVDSELNGDFNLTPLSYGATGTAYLSALLFVGDFGTVVPPTEQVLGTALTYDYSVSGLGTSVVDIVYTITNTNAGTDAFDAFSDLRFLVNVQVDGSASFNDNVAVKWPALRMAGDPDDYQVDTFFSGLKQQIQSAGKVSGTDNCGGVCDADLGLQWNLDVLPGGGTSWVVALRLVDDESLLTGDGRFLVATSADTAGTALYLGNPQVVPLPAPFGMLLGALGGLALLRKRRTG